MVSYGWVPCKWLWIKKFASKNRWDWWILNNTEYWPILVDTNVMGLQSTYRWRARGPKTRDFDFQRFKGKPYIRQSNTAKTMVSAVRFPFLRRGTLRCHPLTKWQVTSACRPTSIKAWKLLLSAGLLSTTEVYGFSGPGDPSWQPIFWGRIFLGMTHTL